MLSLVFVYLIINFGMSAHKKGQTLHVETRALVQRVIQKCDEEALKGSLLHPIHNISARVTDYTGLSARTIFRIKKEKTEPGGRGISPPGKKRPRITSTEFQCTEDDRRAIRNVIHKFYTVWKIVPTGPKLLTAIREKIDFPWEIHTLRKILKQMGFKFKKTQNLKTILIEKPKNVARRGKYLTAIIHHRMENKNIIYVNETSVANTLHFENFWQNHEAKRVLKKDSSSERLIIVHAGGRTGFVPGAALVFTTGKSNGEHDGQMTAASFQKWVEEQLLPNIPENTVVVLDNSPYHLVQLNKAPSKYAKKAEMITWLVENGIGYSEKMKKYELSALVQKYKLPEKTYKIDAILKARGHTVLRIPPNMCELNPMELAWTKLKSYISERDITLTTIESLIQEGLNNITVNDWQDFCRHTEELERKYNDRDRLLEEALEDFHLQDTESNEEESSSEDE